MSSERAPASAWVFGTIGCRICSSHHSPERSSPWAWFRRIRLGVNRDFYDQVKPALRRRQSRSELSAHPCDVPSADDYTRSERRPVCSTAGARATLPQLQAVIPPGEVRQSARHSAGAPSRKPAQALLGRPQIPLAGTSAHGRCRFLRKTRCFQTFQRLPSTDGGRSCQAGYVRHAQRFRHLVNEHPYEAHLHLGSRMASNG